MIPDGDGNTVKLAGEQAALLHLGGRKNAVSVEEAAHSELLFEGGSIPASPKSSPMGQREPRSLIMGRFKSGTRNRLCRTISHIR